MGMTANVTATTAFRGDVVAVPNAALRFRPADGTAVQAPARKPGFSTVWRIGEGENLEPVAVRTGITNGSLTEVVEGELKPGDKLALAAPVAGQARGAAAPGNSPFTPQRRGGVRR